MTATPLALLVLLLASASASAGLIETSGLVTYGSDSSGPGWQLNGAGVDLFEPAAGRPWAANNSSPLLSVTAGAPPESYDLEGLFYTYDGATGDISIWLVTSMGPSGTDGTRDFCGIGDVFIDVDSALGNGYDYCFISFGERPGLNADRRVWNDSYGNHWSPVSWRDPGMLVPITSRSILYGVNGPGLASLSDSLREAAGPWALQNPRPLPGNDLLWQCVTDPALGALDCPGSSLISTYVYKWTGVLPAGLDANSMKLHAAFQRGDDYVDVPIVNPAPTSALLAACALVLLAAAKRARSSRARS